MTLARLDCAKLVGHCLNPALPKSLSIQIRARYAALSEIEWLELFSFADRTMTIPGWFLSLRRLGWLEMMPSTLRDGAEAAWLLNRDRNVQLVKEAREISTILAEIDVPTVYLKGIGNIINGTHGDVGARLTTDLDILVPKDRVEDAARYLMSKGGSYVSRGDRPFVSVMHDSHHLESIILRENGAQIELHYDFVRRRKIWPSSTDIMDEASKVPASGDGAVPHPDHAANLAMAHSFLRSATLPGADLHFKDVWDFVMICEAGKLDLGALQARNTAARQGAAFGAMVHCAESFFGLDASAYGLERRSLQHKLAGQIALWNLARHPQNSTEPHVFSSWSLRSYLQIGYLLISNRGYRQHAVTYIKDPDYRDVWRSRRRA